MIDIIFTPKVEISNYNPETTTGISFYDKKNNYLVSCIIDKNQDMEGIIKDIRSWADEIESDLEAREIGYVSCISGIKPKQKPSSWEIFSKKYH